MSNPAYVVALVLGAVMLLSVCFVYVKHQILQLGGMSLSAFAVVLVGMSVWKSIDVSMDEKGFKAKLDQAIAVAAEAKQETAQVKQISQMNTEAALALKESIEAIKTQESLRSIGIYKGALDGQFGSATRKSLLEFQEMKNLPRTGTLDPKTIKELGIEPIQKFPNLEKILTTPSTGTR